MTNQKACEWVRDRLTAEGALRPEAETAAHLTQCPQCNAYARALHACRESAPAEPLYTPALKARALAAVGARTEMGARPPLALLAAGAVLSLGVTFILPGCASGWFFSHVIGSSRAMAALGWGFALGSGFFISLAGMIPAGLTLLKEENHV